MSGIAGIFHRDGRNAAAPGVASMIAAIAHRGTDGSGVWVEGPLGIGYCALWTTPESIGESRPVTRSVAGLAIVADVRLDERANLAAQLGLDAREAARASDSLLILQAYEKWGEDCTSHLFGDFAFALWDGRRRSLLCARDVFGVKPLVYFLSRDVFVFASEPRALFRHPFVPRVVNEARIADYLVPVLELYDKTSTFYENVHRLEPAHNLTIRADGTSRRCYWSLDPSRETRCGSDEEYAEAFRAVFTGAVSSRLRNASGVASMLSGGLDSSSIVGVARQLSLEGSGDLFRTVSAISADEASCGETRAIRAVLRMGGLDGYTVRPDELADHAPWFLRVLQTTDDPFDGSMLHVPLTMYSAARSLGVNALLDGIDGDIVASLGSWYIAYLLRSRKWMAAVGESRGRARLANGARQFASVILLRNAWTVFAPAPLRRFRHGIRRTKDSDRTMRDSIIAPDFAKSIGVEERLRELEPLFSFWPEAWWRERQASTIAAAFVTAGVERYGRIASLLSIEPRHPFLDRKLVEFCLSLPADQRVRQGWTKFVVRRAMKGVLPGAVRWREESDHLGERFLSGYVNLVRRELCEMLPAVVDQVAPYVRTDILRRDWKQLAASEAGTPGADVAASRLCEAATLALWLGRSIGNGGSKDASLDSERRFSG